MISKHLKKEIDKQAISFESLNEVVMTVSAIIVMNKYLGKRITALEKEVAMLRSNETVN